MVDALAASIVHVLSGMKLGTIADAADNRIAIEGLTWEPAGDDTVEVKTPRCEAASLRVASGPIVVDVGRVALHQLVARLRIAGGAPRVLSLQADEAEITGVKLEGPLVFSPPGASTPASAPAASAPSAGAWCLGPLAAADGILRAEIVDAHLLFDADVTIPIRHGNIYFNDATVEHVGPDSRMGVSRLGLYVDAPNGRSYLYQFTSAPVAGVEFERRGALLGPWVTDRGNLRLQPFGEGLLRQGPVKAGMCFTDQARLLLDRTALSGEVRLDDGRFTAPGLQGDLAGRAAGHNTIRVHSDAVGRGLAADISSFVVREARLHAGRAQLACDEITGSVMARLFVQEGQWRFGIEVPKVSLARLRMQPSAPADVR